MAFDAGGPSCLGKQGVEMLRPAGQAQRLAGGRVRQLQGAGVQQQARSQRLRGGRGVERVARNRQADGSQVHAQLVGAARDGPQTSSSCRFRWRKGART